MSLDLRRSAGFKTPDEDVPPMLALPGDGADVSLLAGDGKTWPLELPGETEGIGVQLLKDFLLRFCFR